MEVILGVHKHNLIDAFWQSCLNLIHSTNTLHIFRPHTKILHKSHHQKFIFFKLQCVVANLNWTNSQVPQCTSPISHDAPFCNRTVHMCSHFCYKMVHCGKFFWCTVGFVRRVYYPHTPCITHRTSSHLTFMGISWTPLQLDITIHSEIVWILHEYLRPVCSNNMSIGFIPISKW